MNNKLILGIFFVVMLSVFVNAQTYTQNLNTTEPDSPSYIYTKYFQNKGIGLLPDKILSIDFNEQNYDDNSLYYINMSRGGSALTYFTEANGYFAQFDGTSYLQYNDTFSNQQFDYNNGSNFTIFARIQTNDGSADILNHRVSTGYMLRIYANTISFFSASSAGNADCNSPTIINDSKWHNIVVTVNQTGKWIFIDGVYNWFCTILPNGKGDINQTGIRLTVGGSAGTGTYTGNLSSIIMLNRSVTMQEIADYNNSFDNNMKFNRSAGQYKNSLTLTGQGGHINTITPICKTLGRNITDFNCNTQSETRVTVFDGVNYVPYNNYYATVKQINYTTYFSGTTNGNSSTILRAFEVNYFPNYSIGTFTNLPQSITQNNIVYSYCWANNTLGESLTSGDIYYKLNSASTWTKKTGSIVPQKTYYIIGDSIAKGNYTPWDSYNSTNKVEDSWAYMFDVLAKTNISLINSTNQSIYNKGIGSQTCDQVLARFDNNIVNNSDGVFIICGLNDISYSHNNDEIIQDFGELYNLSVSKGVKPYFNTLVPYHNAGWCDNITYINDWLKNNLTVLTNATVIDLYSALDSGVGCTFNSTLLSGDNIHPNSAGYQVLAQKEWEGINKLVVGSYEAKSNLSTIGTYDFTCSLGITNFNLNNTLLNAITVTLGSLPPEPSTPNNNNQSNLEEWGVLLLIMAIVAGAFKLFMDWGTDVSLGELIIIVIALVILITVLASSVF